MYKALALLTLVVSIILVGCGTLFRVKVHDAANPSGIPFYSVVGTCTQQTVYANPYYLLTLKVSGASGVRLLDTVKVSSIGRNSSDFERLMTELGKPQPEFKSVQDAWDALKLHKSFDPNTQTEGEFLLINSRKTTTTVDYAHTYSLNQRKPLAGNASADYKLSPDGTLGEVQGQIQDDTLSTILSALPISDLIKSAAGIAAKAGAAEAEKKEPVQFSLEQEERVKTRTYSLTTAYVANCPAGARIKADTAEANVTVADTGAKEIASKEDTSKSDSSISISGTVTLPKALLPQAAKTDGSSGAAPSGSGGAPAGSSKPPASGNDKSNKKDTGKKPAKKGSS